MVQSRHFIPTTVVSGFPAIGKSYLAKQFPTYIRDLESSDFHWDEIDGQKVVNPGWPNNYIESIKALDRSGMYHGVMVSSHEDIRKLMGRSGIKYTCIFPKNDADMKAIIVNRCVKRQSPQAFIDNLTKNWDLYIDSMKNDPYAIAKIELTTDTIEDWQRRILYI